MSNYTATLQIGRIRYAVNADTERGLFERLSLFAEMPDRCGNPECNETALQPRYRAPQGNDYYSLDCPLCGWRYTYGITKEDKKLFPHRKWEPPYVPGGNGDEERGRGGEGERPRRDSGPVPTHARRETEATADDRRDLEERWPSEEPRRTYGAGKAYGQR